MWPVVYHCRGIYDNKFRTNVVVVGFYDALNISGHCVAFYSEREKADKFYSETLISAWGSFTCCKSTTRDPRLYFLSEGSLIQDLYTLKKIHRPRPSLNSRTLDPVESMITTGSSGSTTKVSFPQVFPLNLCMNFWIAPCVLYDLPILEFVASLC